MRFVALLLPVSALCLLAQDASLRQSNGWWTESVSGVVEVPAGWFKLHMRGRTTVHGDGSTKSVSYTLRRKVRAASEAEARRHLAMLAVKSGPGFLALTYPDRPRALGEMDLRVPAGLRLLAVESHSGDINVEGIAGQVSAESGGGSIRMNRIGREATARTAGGDIVMGTMAASVKCVTGGGNIDVDSAGGESWFDTAGGEINLGQISGPIHASTNGGNIQIGSAGSSVAVRTAGGRIEVRQARGVVVAGNSGGSIQVGRADGVRLEATGGSIRLRGSSGALRAVSDVGSILAELFPGAGIRDSLLSTGAGDITVFIPSNIALTIHALNESGRSGRIVSEFPEVPVRPSLGSSRPAMLAEGELNGGGPVLKLTSSGGTIYLRRVRY